MPRVWKETDLKVIYDAKKKKKSFEVQCMYAWVYKKWCKVRNSSTANEKNTGIPSIIVPFSNVFYSVASNYHVDWIAACIPYTDNNDFFRPYEFYYALLNDPM